jgi:DNA-binding NarL/FixJ family response regulator
MADHGMTAPTLRVLVADDHPIVREGLRAVLEVLPDFELVGAAASGLEAVSLAAATAPDIIVMDLHMPGLDGVEATRTVLAHNPRIQVLVLTMHDDEELLVAALGAGARGYLLKGASHTDIVQALRSVAAGRAVFGSHLADLDLNRLSGSPAYAPLTALTAPELEILDLLARGAESQEIARRLHLSPEMIASHTANIVAKLGVRDGGEAVARARAAGLGAAAPEP